MMLHKKDQGLKPGADGGVLVGLGLYTPADAARLTGVSAGKIIRWLRGHRIGDRHYDALWDPQVDLDDGSVYLGFRDLMEVRVADAFVRRDLSPQKLRRAIELAREMIGGDWPLSTKRFRTDGRTVFMQIAREDGGSDELVDLFTRQQAFLKIVEPSLSNVDFDQSGIPARWWPIGRKAKILVDPDFAFGQPIEEESHVPTAALAAAVQAEGSVSDAARVWAVPQAAVRRSVRYQNALMKAA